MPMNTRPLAPNTEAEVWLHILHPDGKFSPRAARAILGLSFSKDHVARMHELSAKARAGSLTPDEEQRKWMTSEQRLWLDSIHTQIQSPAGAQAFPSRRLTRHGCSSHRAGLGTRSPVL